MVSRAALVQKLLKAPVQPGPLGEATAQLEALIADAAADLKSRSRNGTAGYPVENVIIDRPQNRLPLPNRTIVVKNTGHV